MKLSRLFVLLGVAGAACGPEPGLLEDQGSSGLVGVMSYGNCTQAEQDKLNAAVQLLVQITGTQFSGPGSNYPFYEACLASAGLVENNGWTGVQIATQLRMNTITGIWCATLPPNVVAQASQQYFNNEELDFNRSFIASLSPINIAGTIGHELMHNRGFVHDANPFGTPNHPLTVPEQVEACIENFAPNRVPAAPQWTLLPGTARDLGVGSDGSVWEIGTNPVGAGSDFGVRNWNRAVWNAVDGGGVRIAVGSDGNPWIVNSAGQIYRRLNNTWTIQPGLAKDIGAGTNGAVWAIGTTPVGAGSDFNVLRWNGASWDNVDGGGVRIAVAPDGNAWMINSAGNIYRRQNDAWVLLPGLAKDIGAGANGSVWVIGTTPVGAGSDFSVHRWNGSGWDSFGGGGVAISVGPSGDPWLVNSAGSIFHRI